ncbi:MAG: UbiA family prenyltransferase [Chloroflexi bacterium]|nr:UbiA family prenyltransferase [Chloroflexota bacterium]
MVRIIHPFPVATVIVTSALLLIVAHRGWPGMSIEVRAVAMILASQVCVGAMNDYHDRDADALWQPSKPIPSGLVSPRVALATSNVGGMALVPFAASFGRVALVLALIGLAGGLAYDLWLKPTAFGAVGYAIGFLSLVTWIWLVAGAFRPLFLLVYPVGSLLLLSAHLANSLPDIDGDRALGQNGLAVRLGARRTVVVMLASYALVALVGVSVSVVAHSALALLLTSLSIVLLVAAAVGAQRGPLTSPRRALLFRMLAPGVGLLGIGCLIALASLT